MSSDIRSYKDLTVWQKSMELVILIYQLTVLFPADERFGLTSQMRRCAVSIPSNIAEGSRRRTAKDRTHFLNIAFASGAELETQLEVSRRLSFIKSSKFTNANTLLSEVLCMLNKMLTNLRAF